MSKRPPFRLTAPIPPEDDLHEAVAQALDRLLMPPAEWACYPAGHIPLAARWATKLLRMGLRRGWPDFLIVYAGRIFGVELKREGGGLSRTRVVHTKRGRSRIIIGQTEMFPRLEAAGMLIAICDSVAAVLRALAAWGVPLRGRIAA
jgi:hypothetical protein